MHPGTPTGERAFPVDHREEVLAALDRDHPDQDGSLASCSAPHAGAHRTLWPSRIRGDLMAVHDTLREPDPGSSLEESSAPAHEP